MKRAIRTHLHVYFVVVVDFLVTYMNSISCKQKVKIKQLKSIMKCQSVVRSRNVRKHEKGKEIKKNWNLKF